MDEKTDPCNQKWLEPLPWLRVIIVIKTIIIIVGQIVPAPGSPTAEMLILWEQGGHLSSRAGKMSFNAHGSAREIN